MIRFYAFTTVFAITKSQSSYITTTKLDKQFTHNTSDIFNDHSPSPQWLFKDYLQKFSAARVWEAIQKENSKLGLKRAMVDELDAMLNGIDETDELLSLKVPNGDPKVVIKDGRRWEPPGGLSTDKRDRWSINRRFLELMKQAIYQARNKMVIMQDLRNKYNKQSLYKMGYLMSKTDQACKSYCKFTYKAFQSCYETRLRFNRVPLIDLLESYERSLNMWFEIELLVDLVRKNHKNCEQVLNKVRNNLKAEWKFVD